MTELRKLESFAASQVDALAHHLAVMTGEPTTKRLDPL